VSKAPAKTAPKAKSAANAARKVQKTAAPAVAATVKVQVAPVAATPAPAAKVKAPVKPAAKVPAAVPPAPSKLVAALKAAQAKAMALTRPAAEQPPAVQNEANKGGVTEAMQKAQKKIETAPAARMTAHRPLVSTPGAAPVAPAPAVVQPVAQAARPAEKTALERPVPFAKAPERAPAKPVKPTGNRHGFKTSEFIVYPAHGVGQITAIEEQEVAGFTLELFVISFIKDKMILKVPTPKVASVGMRKLAEAPVVTRALDTLTGRARIKRTMWSRRAQEYEAKINSGDLISIAEVVRDLYRSDAQPEQSYSERQLYEAAVDRMAREIGAVNKLTETEALKLIEANLQKGPRRGKAEEVEEAESEDGDIEEAA
jgi:CarD family transcriptional regulator